MGKLQVLFNTLKHPVKTYNSIKSAKHLKNVLNSESSKALMERMFSTGPHISFDDLDKFGKQ